MIGERMSPVLAELESALWEHEAAIGGPPRFTDEGFRAATKIFMAALMDKMWTLQAAESLPIDVRSDMALKAGEQVRQVVKTFTNIDTHDLYKP